jgi:DNA-binding NarL/FixJ family response regulator
VVAVHPVRSTPARVAVVAADPARRRALRAAVSAREDLDPLAWAEDVEALLVLRPRLDLVLLADPPAADELAALDGLGVAVRVAGPGGALLPPPAQRPAQRPDPGPARPVLSARQREVLAAYAATSDLLPTVARALGVDEETVKTHLRRIRAKYAALGRPAPTRRDLYVRAVEDGLLSPPSGTEPPPAG